MGAILAMENNVEAPRNHGNKAPLGKKELLCKYCNKKFTNYQALGGHQNAHKDERAAAHKEKILSMASAYNTNSFIGGKTLGVSPLSLTYFKSHYSWSHHMALKRDYHHVSWPGHQALDGVQVQPTIHQLQTLMGEGSGLGFYQHHKSYQPLTFPTFRGGAPNSESQTPLLLNLLCDEGNFGQTSNSSIRPQNAFTERTELNVKTLCDHENSGEASTLSSISASEVVTELDLTLKI